MLQLRQAQRRLLALLPERKPQQDRFTRYRCTSEHPQSRSTLVSSDGSICPDDSSRCRVPSTRILIPFDILSFRSYLGVPSFQIELHRHKCALSWPRERLVWSEEASSGSSIRFGSWRRSNCRTEAKSSGKLSLSFACAYCAPSIPRR
jgi:hypothetical protein